MNIQEQPLRRKEVTKKEPQALYVEGQEDNFLCLIDGVGAILFVYVV